MKKKSYLIHRSWCVLLLGSLAFIALAIYCLQRGESLWGGIGLGCAAFFLLSTLILPAYTKVDKKGIVIRYLPFSKEVFLWEYVDSISIEYDTAIPYVFDVFVINGQREDTPRFYKDGKLVRTRRVQRILERYWGKPIEGFISPEIKGYFARRRAKIEKQRTPAVGEIPAFERKVRKLLRDNINKIADKGTTVDYVYKTRDGERRDRPCINYSYVARLTAEDGSVREITLMRVKRSARLLRATQVVDTRARLLALFPERTK